MSKNATLKSMFRSLAHRNYRLFFIGQLISMIGTWMQTIAQSWLIYSLTHSATLLGITNFLSLIPALLISPYAGVIADHHNRRHILYVTQASSMVLALALGVLTLLNIVQVWQILILAALLGIVNAFDIPARQAFIVEMVGETDLINAIALNSILTTGAKTIGPAVAGVLVAIVGEGYCFIGNGLSYIPVLICLYMMHLTHRKSLHRKASHVEHIVEGFLYVIHKPIIRALLLLLGLCSMVGLPYAVFMPVFADEILHGGPKGLGILMGLNGAGALIGALILSAKVGLRGLGRLVATSCFVFGLSLMAFSLSRNFWVSGLLMVIVGFSMTLQFASINTLLQALVTDHVRGRVMSFYYMMFIGTTPFGSLIAGALAKPLGVSLTIACGGAICMLGSILFWRGLPRFRKSALELLTAKTQDQVFAATAAVSIPSQKK